MNEPAFHALLNVAEKDSYFAQARDIFTRVCSLRDLPFNEFVTRYPNEMNRLIAREISIDHFFLRLTQFLSAVSSVYALGMGRGGNRSKGQKKIKVSNHAAARSLLAFRVWDTRVYGARAHGDPRSFLLISRPRSAGI